MTWETHGPRYAAWLAALLTLGIAPGVVAEVEVTPEKIACAKNARSVIQALKVDSEASFTPDESSLAYRAAYASCLRSVAASTVDASATQFASATPADVDVPTPAESVSEVDDRSRWERFWAGLFSIENKQVKKRAGKYRYVVDE